MDMKQLVQTEQPVDISDDEKLGQVFDESEFENMYIDIGGGDE